MGEAVSVNARLSETCFSTKRKKSVIMKHFWSGDIETESVLRGANPIAISTILLLVLPELSANGITTFCYSDLRSGVIYFYFYCFLLLCFFDSRGKKIPSPKTDYRSKRRGHDRRLLLFMVSVPSHPTPKK